jgi:hypothetical protein
MLLPGGHTRWKTAQRFWLKIRKNGLKTAQNPFLGRRIR